MKWKLCCGKLPIIHTSYVVTKYMAKFCNAQYISTTLFYLFICMHSSDNVPNLLKSTHVLHFHITVD